MWYESPVHPIKMQILTPEIWDGAWDWSLMSWSGDSGEESSLGIDWLSECTETLSARRCSRRLLGSPCAPVTWLWAKRYCPTPGVCPQNWRSELCPLGCVSPVPCTSFHCPSLICRSSPFMYITNRAERCLPISLKVVWFWVYSCWFRLCHRPKGPRDIFWGRISIVAY